MNIPKNVERSKLLQTQNKLKVTDFLASYKNECPSLLSYGTG